MAARLGQIADAGSVVLGVRRSVTGRVWADRLDAGAHQTAARLVQAHDLADVLARVVAGRGIAAQEAERFLSPSIREAMPDPSILTDMDAAAARIADAITSGEPVAIFGDYDVDGATSSAILARFLCHQGAEPTIYIPDRIVEGYGPNGPAIAALHDAGARLLVTVDCGTLSFEAFETARERGLDVVVVDHHQAGETVVPAVAVVNPNRQDDLSGLGYLCAAGLAFMTVVAVNRELRRRGWYASRSEPDLLALLDLVALGTVADVVPLIGLNRAFVTKGLLAVRARANPGLSALADVARLAGPPSAYHLGFLLGPRINAGGRIGDAALGARLLATDDRHDAARIAAELDALNSERQAAETVMLDDAETMAVALLTDADPAVLVVASAGWHPGIVGLIAARLKERHKRPAVALCLDGSGLATGSARSIAGVDIGRAVRAAVDDGLLLKGGGHAMAAGMTLEAGKIDAFSAYLDVAVGEAVREADAEHRLAIDASLVAAGATHDLVAAIERAGPFGTGNPEPVFAFPAHRLMYADPAGAGHVRATLSASDGSRIRAIAFRCQDRPLGDFLLKSRGETVHVAGALALDHWQGEARVQLRIVDAADPRSAHNTR